MTKTAASAISSNGQ